MPPESPARLSGDDVGTEAVPPLELMRQRNSLMHSPASVANGREFTPRASDVFIVTYPKCGTTWMTQLCHQIRCVRHARKLGMPASATATSDESADAGVPSSCFSMRFGEITEVVPWDILAKDCDQSLDDEQFLLGSEAFAKTPLHPRLFKSHETAASIARGGKYVCVVRNPLDVFLSFYEFLPPYMGLERGAVSMEAFCDAIFAGASHSGDAWSHFLGWLDRRNVAETKMRETAPATARDEKDDARAERVLLVSFEEMKRDLRAVARRVATFMKTQPDDDELSEADLDFVTRMSGFERMRADATRFDDHFVRRKMWERVGIPERDWRAGGVGKVREGGGRVGGGRAELPESVRAKIAEKWAEIMAPRGFATYTDFCDAVENHEGVK